MTIATNTAIDYTNRIIDLFGVDASTPFEILVLYSYIKEQFKLSPNADDDFAFDAPTPFDLTLKNKWYLRRHSIPRLKGGSITTNYGLNEIERIDFAAGGYTSAIESDIGKVVVGTGFAGDAVLVDFDNTRRSWWVRTNGTATSVADSTAITITAGTGAGTTTGASVDGDDQWAGIQTIGDLVLTGPQPLMYVYTGDLTTGDNNGVARRNEGREDDFDEELTGADRGPLTILVPIKEQDVVLGNPAGEIRVYARQGLDNGSDFQIAVNAGGLVSIPISNANDVEDTLGSYAIAVDGQSATNFVAGEEITEDTAIPAWKAEVIEYIEGVDASTSVLILRGLTAPITNNDAFTGTTSGATGVARGSQGGQVFTYDVETDGILQGDYGITLTASLSTHQSILRGHLTITEGGGTRGYAIVESNHDFEADPDFYDAIVDNDVFTGTGVNVTGDLGSGGRADRLASDLDDVRIKPAFQRLTGITAGDAARGDNITQAVSGANGTIVEVVSGTEVHVSTNDGVPFDTTNTISDDDGGTISGTPTTAPRDRVFDYALPLQSAFEYNIMIDGNGRTNAEIYHYIKHFLEARSIGTFPTSADQAKELYLTKEELGGGTQILQKVEGEEFFRPYTDEDTPANNPTGSDAKSRLSVKNGTTIVTAQGVALINVASADANFQTLTDAAGVQHSPFVSVSISITNNFIGAHLHIALDDGSGQEDKAQFTSGVGNAAGDADFVITGTAPNDTPTSGTIKVIDTSSSSPENKEMRYRYASFSGSTFTLVAGNTGTAEASSSGNTLVDTAAFAGVEVGDPIRNTLDGSIAWVKEIVDANTIITTQLEGGTSDDWVLGDTWETNTLVVAYVSVTDTAYIPYLDIVVDAATETQTLTFVTDRNIVGVHREETLLDVVFQGTITTSGFSFRVSQTLDDKFTPT